MSWIELDFVRFRLKLQTTSKLSLIVIHEDTCVTYLMRLIKDTYIYIYK